MFNNPLNGPSGVDGGLDTEFSRQFHGEMGSANCVELAEMEGYAGQTEYEQMKDSVREASSKALVVGLFRSHQTGPGCTAGRLHALMLMWSMSTSHRVSCASSECQHMSQLEVGVSNQFSRSQTKTFHFLGPAGSGRTSAWYERVQGARAGGRTRRSAHCVHKAGGGATSDFARIGGAGLSTFGLLSHVGLAMQSSAALCDLLFGAEEQ